MWVSFDCCRYNGAAKHIRIQRAEDGSYYLASCHVFPTISVRHASLVLSLDYCNGFKCPMYIVKIKDAGM